MFIPGYLGLGQNRRKDDATVKRVRRSQVFLLDKNVLLLDSSLFHPEYFTSSFSIFISMTFKILF